jgi:membrane-bound lytic murein transglycosylase F
MKEKQLKNFKRLTTFLVITTIIVFGFLLIRYFLTKEDDGENKRDYPNIKKEGVLRVVISTNPIDYFIYQGQPMGFQLEMLEDFVEAHNLKLEIIMENDPEKAMQMLMDRDCDILAQSIINTADRDLIVDFTIPVRHTKQVLVQRVTADGLESDSLIRDLSELELKTLYIQKGSANLKSLKNLASELIQNFYVVEIDSMSQEQMIKNVAEDLYDYVVCDYNIAKISQSYYPNIDIETDMSFPQSISWCVRPESELLLDSLNFWLGEYLETESYTKLNRKYINNNRTLVDINSEFYSGNEGLISEYDKIIKKYAPIIGWDWRLVASLIYEESRFNSNAESWAGASGLMQLMPIISQKYSDSNLTGAEAEIYAGIKYLEYLDSQLPTTITDSADRVKFILASFNIGPGHVEDAIRLTEKYKKESYSWNDVSYYLANLSNPKYYKDTAVKHGYFPGIYSVDFANSIVNRYQHYLNIIPK